jgi:endonuclease/exonuclease/phosphatase family metal-dependent hydrolase
VATPLRVLTYNIRKGKGASGRAHHDVAEVGRALAAQRADLVLCQEVFHGHASRAAQSRELAEATGLVHYYRPNKHRRTGHHGNATLSRLPVAHVENHDVSTNRIERRGALYTRVDVHGRPLHVLNVHLSLSHRQREKQLRRISSFIAGVAGRHEPIVLAGDFNDWPGRLDATIVGQLGFTNVFGSPARTPTWHARRPVFNLDRVYVRNVNAVGAERLHGEPWDELSDHLPLAVELEID